MVYEGRSPTVKLGKAITNCLRHTSYLHDTNGTCFIYKDRLNRDGQVYNIDKAEIAKASSSG